jgi:hypothetical protein
MLEGPLDVSSFDSVAHASCWGECPASAVASIPLATAALIFKQKLIQIHYYSLANASIPPSTWLVRASRSYSQPFSYKISTLFIII